MNSEQLMIIQPKVRGFICTAAHPVGCAKNVDKQIDYVKQQGEVAGCKNVLIIGASTGYGLASRIVSTFGCGAKTIGVFFERGAAGKRTASAGWYNTAAFEQVAHEAGFYAKSINGDAFSDEIKQQTIDLIKQDLGKVDLVIYSLASPRRTDPRSGETYSSCLKPIGETFSNKTVDPMRGEVKDVSIEPAEGDDIANTVKVMGGEDWQWWMDALREADVVTDDVITMAYSYIGPGLTHAVYKNGTIGKAKDHLQETSDNLNKQLEATGGKSFISVNKAVVTQASSAIPVVPLYMSILFKLMKEKGTHEGCIEQMYRLFKDFLYNPDGTKVDDKGRIRIDDLEMLPDIQEKVVELWGQVNTDNLGELTDIESYRHYFYELFGFELDGIDYQADVDPNVEIESMK
jgi:enoyl-[acyl-carrier protein] reductase/trans-2-enoyl-CoA reductase (NAD+)